MNASQCMMMAQVWAAAATVIAALGNGPATYLLGLFVAVAMVLAMLLLAAVKVDRVGWQP